MTEDQKKRMHPGAYKSCLTPYAEAIFSWWYDEQLPAAEIQRRLKQAGIVVSLSTITRFIKVRERLAAKRQKPANLSIASKQILITKSSETKVVSQAPEKTLIRDVNSTHQGDHVNNNTTDLPSKQDIEEAEAMLQKLKNSTPQQLGLEEEEAMMRMKKK